jgi:hypothetical protein
MSIASTGLSRHERRSGIQTTEPTQPTGQPQHLDVHEAARFLRVSKSHLGKLRCSGRGPKYCKPPGTEKILYRLDWLVEWLDGAVFTSTSDEAVKRNMPPSRRGRPRKAASPAPDPEPSRPPRQPPIEFKLD